MCRPPDVADAAIVWLLLMLLLSQSCSAKPKPHIILIMADDLGYNDVGFHGSDQIHTPNIDALATFGIALNRYYVGPMCTPSRSSLMTGKYPSHVGMQHFVIPSAAPYGLGLDQKLLPEYMREGGYRTHIIGKWHLGFYKKQYTPTQRGFDSHFGYLGPYVDYFNHSLTHEYDGIEENGYDMRSNLTLNYASKGTYATDLFAQVAVDTIDQHPKHLPMFMYLPHLAPHAANGYEPLQALGKDLERFNYIDDPSRRIYAAMVYRLDIAVGRVVDALRRRQMLDNSVIVFCSDNGAPMVGEYSNAGSNYPLKGQKNSPWEGAMRAVGAIWSPLLKQRQRSSDQLFHISDWMPTFAHLAGVTISGPIDGHNIWEALSSGTTSPRSEMLGILDIASGFSSLIRNEWKYVNGTTDNGRFDDVVLFDKSHSGKHPSLEAYGDTVLTSLAGQALLAYSVDAKLNASDVDSLRIGSSVQECRNVAKPDEDYENLRCNPLVEPCLFHVLDDPCERRNVADVNAHVMREMETAIERFRKSSVAARNVPDDERSDPKYFNNTWTWWYDELGLADHSSNAQSGGELVQNVNAAFGMGLLLMCALFEAIQ